MKDEFWHLVTQLIGWFWRVIRVMEKYAKMTKLESICEQSKLWFNLIRVVKVL